MEKNLREIAELTGGTLSGDGTIKISGLSNITMARAGDLTFAVPPHLDEAKICAASAVLIPLEPPLQCCWSCSRQSWSCQSA